MLDKIVSFFFYSTSKKQQCLLVLLGVLSFIPFIGTTHLFDWDEINFAEISREMIITGEYFRSQINFQSFYEKPPFFNWIQIISFKVFGINEFAARFPNVIFGILSLLMIYKIGKRIKDKAFGMLWALLFLGSLLPFFFFKTGIIDPVFNFFIFLSIDRLIVAHESNKWRDFFIAGLINGIAIITKGPVGLLIVLLTWILYHFIYNRIFSWSYLKKYLFFVSATFLVTMIWLLPQYISGGTDFIINFFEYMIGLFTEDIATHGQPFYYHFVVIGLWCFPIVIYGLKNLLKKPNQEESNFYRWMFLLFWVVLILFSLVKTKIIHYSSMTYIPISYLAADVIQNSKKSFLKKLFLIIGLFHALVFLLSPILTNFYKDTLLEWSKNDTFAIEVVKDLNIPIVTILYGIFFLILVCYTYILFRKNYYHKGVLIYTLGFVLFFNIELGTILPSIEKAVQGGAIEFYERYKNKDVYLSAVGYHSYGQHYYFGRKVEQSKYTTKELLSDKEFKKPVYFVIRINHLEEFRKRKNVVFVEKKGGFVLFKKDNNNKQ